MGRSGGRLSEEISWPDIYKVLKGGETRDGMLRKALESFLSNPLHCSKVIGRGSFGTVEDRSQVLLEKSEIFAGKTTVFPNLILKQQQILDGRSVTPEHPDSIYPFYFSVSGHGSSTVLDTDNRQETGGFLTEVIANMLCTELFKTVSPHFVYFAGFSHCRGTFEFYSENIAFVNEEMFSFPLSSLESHLNMWHRTDVPITEDMICSILLGVFHSLHLVKKNFDMTHFDTHIGNIYVKVLDDSNYFLGENMLKYKYFAYHFGPKVFYVKNCGFVIKLGDLGLSQFTFGKSTFTNKIARTIRRPEVFIPYYQKRGEHPDFLLFLGQFISRFSQNFIALDKIAKNVYPLNARNGVDTSSFMEGGSTFDPDKIPLFADLVGNMGIFSHLEKPPKIADSRILHIYDHVISDKL